MAEQDRVSLQEMQTRFEQHKKYELEIACEMTIPVTISVYRGEKDDGSIPPLSCHLQFGEEASYWADLFGPDNEMVSTLEEVAEAFNVPMDAKIWEITIEDNEED